MGSSHFYLVFPAARPQGPAALCTGPHAASTSRASPPAGFLRDSLVPNCALLCSTLATAVQPPGLGQFVANGIRQLQNRLSTETRNCPAASPLQGECRRFDPVSTHQ